MAKLKTIGVTPVPDIQKSVEEKEQLQKQQEQAAMVEAEQLQLQISEYSLRLGYSFAVNNDGKPHEIAKLYEKIQFGLYQFISEPRESINKISHRFAICKIVMHHHVKDGKKGFSDAKANVVAIEKLENSHK